MPVDQDRNLEEELLVRVSGSRSPVPEKVLFDEVVEGVADHRTCVSWPETENELKVCLDFS